MSSPRKSSGISARPLRTPADNLSRLLPPFLPIELRAPSRDAIGSRNGTAILSPCPVPFTGSCAALMLLVTFFYPSPASEFLIFVQTSRKQRRREPVRRGATRAVRREEEGIRAVLSLSLAPTSCRGSLRACVRVSRPALVCSQGTEGGSHLLLNPVKLARPPLSHPRPSAGGWGDRAVHSKALGEEERRVPGRSAPGGGRRSGRNGGGED